MSSSGSKVLLFCLLAGTVIAQVDICPDKKTICQSYEACITWERGCSMGANCLEPGIYEKFTECIQIPVKPPLLPSKALCRPEEIFARGIDKLCPKSPCPPRLGYNCYPQKGLRPSCIGIRCPFGTYCIIGENCTDVLCEPKPMCKINF